MRRLYLQIYTAFVLIIVVFALLAALAWRTFGAGVEAQPHSVLTGASAILSKWLPGAERPAAEQQAALRQLADWFHVDATLRATDGGLVAAVGPVSPAAPGMSPPLANEARQRQHRHGPEAVLRLIDGRHLVLHWANPRWPTRLLGALAAMAAAIAIGAYPIARRITRRLERLQTQVDALGQGELSARVEVRGRDEIAQLAHSFNHAAAQIEKLVNAQRSTLANASHELRSPLARLRMGLELMQESARPELKDRMHKDITELDELVGELLLASRLEASERLPRTEMVDLLGLLAEEAARIGAGTQVGGTAVQIRGDTRMLHRMVRNLLENAQRYGGGSNVEARVEAQAGGGAKLVVADRGPGIPAHERERVFEPFYRIAGTPEHGTGVGLGLALVRQIARHHGGEARCLAREGGGTRFEVTLG
jgi:signal transduction histidine kinase